MAANNFRVGLAGAGLATEAVLSTPSNIPISFLPLLPGVADDVLPELLLPQRSWDARALSQVQRELSRQLEIWRFVSLNLSRPLTNIEAVKDSRTGSVISYREVDSMDSDGDARTSASLLREPAPYSDFVRGRTTFKPFLPGGMDASDLLSAPTIEVADESDTAETGYSFLNGVWDTVPPGFTRGLNVTKQELPSSSLANTSATTTSLALALTDLTEEIDWQLTSEAKASNTVHTVQQAKEAPVEQSTDRPAAIDDLPSKLPANALIRTTSSVSTKSTSSAGSQQREFARVIDVRAEFTDFHKLVPNKAHQYPFELDTFQKHAVYHLEKGDSVFVAAHTSAGKTVVAEYAIALAQRHMTRTIYTSPIKALSNQKFRDFRNTFEDVGLLTGDVQIKPEASCLIMTTEILRSMLYRGADIIRDVEWVIFDEVHYINDQERGVVWEEVIIMLPAHVGIILLSATVPNTVEFADWIGRTKQREIFVISTLYRPVPLEYNLFVNRDIFKIVNAKREFLNEGYSRAMEMSRGGPKPPAAAAAGRGGGGGGQSRGGSNSGASAHRGGNKEQQEKSQWINVIDFLRKQSLLPAVVFTFSKRKCETNAANLTTADLTSSSEKSQIHVFIEASLKRLKGSDRDLPQVLRTRELLNRGIAVHHGGILPIIKEMVEILFSKGLVKVLFATETFAMGVNMPARTVVFSSLRKPDGKTGFRELLPGEFTQMAGRAGRRGLDPVGTVILPVFEDMLDTATLSRIMLGAPTKLESKFRLTYQMILNLLRVEELRVQDMMKRSFSEFHNQSALVDQKIKMKQSRDTLLQLPELDCLLCSADLNEYYDTCVQAVTLNYKLQETILLSTQAGKAIGPGRIVVLNNSSHRNAPAVVLKTEMRGTQKMFTCFVLTDDSPSIKTGVQSSAPLPPTMVFVPNGKAAYNIENVPHTDVAVLGKAKFKVELSSILEKPDAKETASLTQKLLQLAQESPQGIEAIHPMKDLKLNDLEFAELFSKHQSLIQRLTTSGHQCLRCPDFKQHYAQLHELRQLKAQVAELEYRLSDRNLQLLPDYEQRLQVLKFLNYINENQTIQLKGRVACEINTTDELIVTEMILENVFGQLQPDEIVALLSCFVFQEKSQSEPNLTENLKQGVDKIKKIASSLVQVQRDCGLTSPEDDSLAKLNFGLVEVVYEWARGMSFKQIMDLTDVMEGSIVRCIVRLDETCRDVRNAAKVIGDSSLAQRCEEASALIKRDVVFAASLYY